MSRRIEYLWKRPCGGRDVLRLALPLIVSTVSWTIMNFIDRMYLFWYSDSAIAAAMPAGMLHFTVICFPLGIVAYVNTFVAQYEGAKRPDRIGLVLGQAIRIGLLSIPFLLLTIPLAPSLFAWSGHPASVQRLEVTYFQILAWGAGGTIVAAAQSSFFTGRGKTRVVMGVDTTAAAINIVLDYLWIFGYAGFPEMGIAGAAWATVLSQWFKVIAYVVLMRSPEVRRKYHLDAIWQYDAKLFRRMLRFGLPQGVQLSAELAAFTLFIMLVGALGESEMVATTIAFNVNAIAFVPMFGLGIALSTIVGQQLGRDRPRLAARATWTALTMALLYTSVMGLLYICVPELFLMGHSAGADPAEFERLHATVVMLLRFVAAYCLFDATAIIFLSAIKGAGDTRFILITTICTAPIPVTIGWLGIEYFGWGLIACWITITSWICVMGAIYFLRFLSGRWRTMRVIEPVFDTILDDLPAESVAFH